LQEERLLQAQRSDDLRRKKLAAKDDVDRAAVLEELRSLDAAVTDARERLRRYEAAAKHAKGEAEKAVAAAEDAESRRELVRTHSRKPWASCVLSKALAICLVARFITFLSNICAHYIV
jgi:hypothetical protein